MRRTWVCRWTTGQFVLMTFGAYLGSRVARLFYWDGKHLGNEFELLLGIAFLVGTVLTWFWAAWVWLGRNRVT